jgi:hypothetical protein
MDKRSFPNVYSYRVPPRLPDTPTLIHLFKAISLLDQYDEFFPPYPSLVGPGLLTTQNDRVSMAVQQEQVWTHDLFLKLTLKSSSNSAGVWTEGDSVIVNILRAMMSNKIRKDSVIGSYSSRVNCTSFGDRFKAVERQVSVNIVEVESEDYLDEEVLIVLITFLKLVDCFI